AGGAGAEARTIRAEDEHAGGGIAVGVVESLHRRALELGADGVEVVGPVERDDPDAAVGGIGHELLGHGRLLRLADVRKMARPSFTVAPVHRGMTGSTTCDG